MAFNFGRLLSSAIGVSERPSSTSWDVSYIPTLSLRTLRKWTLWIRSHVGSRRCQGGHLHLHKPTNFQQKWVPTQTTKILIWPSSDVANKGQQLPGIGSSADESYCDSNWSKDFRCSNFMCCDLKSLNLQLVIYIKLIERNHTQMSESSSS